MGHCAPTVMPGILGDARLPLRCVGVVREAPAMCAQCIAASTAHAIAPNARSAYRELYARWHQQGRLHGRQRFADDLSKFNRLMNLGHDLGKWFEAQLGSTQCRTLTGCDFATAEGVHA